MFLGEYVEHYSIHSAVSLGNALSSFIYIFYRKHLLSMFRPAENALMTQHCTYISLLIDLASKITVTQLANTTVPCRIAICPSLFVWTSTLNFV